MQATDLLLLVVGGYVLIKYGPQIAANFQQGQAAAPPPAAGGAPTAAPPADTTTAPPPAAAPPVTTAQLFGIPQAPTTPPPAPTPSLIQQLFPPVQTPSASISSRFPSGGPSKDTFTQNPSTSSGCKTSAQDPACGFKGHPKCCANNTLLGQPLQLAAGTGPAVSTRAPKKSIPPHKATAGNTQCGGNPCGGSALVPTPGKCLEPTTGSLVACTPTTSAKVAYAYHTQIINGKPHTTIDPFFPAGFYLSQANYRSSLREPALH